MTTMNNLNDKIYDWRFSREDLHIPCLNTLRNKRMILFIFPRLAGIVILKSYKQVEEWSNYING